jgi:hypothetical protein
MNYDNTKLGRDKGCAYRNNISDSESHSCFVSLSCV